jgi:hypothetical protein
MTNEQINIAIAETCGWKNYGLGWSHSSLPPQANVYGRKLPNYCNDLNAMWEAETHLTPDQQVEFAYQLSEIVAPITGESWMLIHASAFSRAKAFLRTVGKWEEAE